MRRFGTTSLYLAGLALLVLAAGGCIFSPEEGGDPPTDPPIVYEWPDTREKLMGNFRDAYGEMNIEEYEKIIHADYKFFFTSNDIYERQDDIASTTNMFNGNPGVDEYGNLKDGVQSISMNTFDISGAWTQMDSTHPYFPDAWRALYNVQIIFYLGSGENTITVTSEQLFYVRSEEVDQGDGTLRTRFFMVGQRDIESPEN